MNKKQKLEQKAVAMKLRILLLLTQCICFKTNYGEENIESSSGEKVKADFFREAEFSDPRYLKTNSPRKIHIGVSMRIIKVFVNRSHCGISLNQDFVTG